MITKTQQDDLILTPFITPRPSASHEAIRRAGAAKIAPKVVKWFSSNEGVSESYVIDDLVSIRYAKDGYAAAKELEDRCGYDPDSDLVEILDDLSWEIRNAETEAVKAWVVAFAIPLDIPIGSQVSGRFGTQNQTEGVVVKHYPETAQYGVHTQGQALTSNWIVVSEQVTLAK